MALKAYVNGTMKKLTRHQMVTFVNGQKKRIPKGVTFVNGEKKVLWQLGTYALHTWTLESLQYPNYISPTYDFLGVEAGENKVVYSFNGDICRANIENLSSPYNDGIVNGYGTITYRKSTSDDNTSYFDASKWIAVSSRRRDYNVYRVNVALSNMGITADQVETSTYSSSSAIVTPVGTKMYFVNGMMVGNGYGLCQVLPVSGAYKIRKNCSASNTVDVVSISSNGYSGTASPTVWSYCLYSNRYILFGAQYQATDGGSYSYSLKKVDITNGNVSTILDNQTSPITSIMVDGNNLIVTVGKTMLKMDANGSVSATYTSSNDMTTLVGRSGDYYYLTTTRTVNNKDYMNVEIIDANDFSSGEVKQTDLRMIQTCSLPYISKNGYLCFSTKSYDSSATVNTNVTGGIGRRSSINQLNSGGTYITYFNVELRVCRIQCI